MVALPTNHVGLQNPEDDLLTVASLGGAQDSEIALKRLEMFRNAIHIFSCTTQKGQRTR